MSSSYKYISTEQVLVPSVSLRYNNSNMKLSDLKGKKVLITQNSLCHIAGSEVVTLELASFFKEQGAKVTVYTWTLNDLLKPEFDKIKVKVTTDDYDSDVIRPDIVWVHHQVIPVGLLEKMRDGIVTPRFFFYHMSALDYLYLEQPYIYNFEKKFATKSLFVSEESLSFNIEKYGNSFEKPSVFPNTFPDYYLKHNENKKSLHRILIVSNHPPEELKQVQATLAEMGLEISSLGHNGTSYQLISPSILKEYDAVITIGKTVQYCLAMNIPVYIYDKFGGCGYLNSKNYTKAKYHNFSGRGFSKKTSNQISKEIVDLFENAKLFQTKNKPSFVESFSLSENIKKILLAKPRVIKAARHYYNYLISAENIARCIVLVDYKNTLDDEIKILNDTIISQNQIIATKDQIIHNMENSRTVKIIKKIHSFSSLLARKKLEDPLKPYRKYYKTIHLHKKQSNKRLDIVGLIREKNESLILDDTLSELEKIVDGFIVLDDNSDDNSIEIAKKHPKCLSIIKNLKTITGDRSMEESIHRELLLELATKYNPKWVFYQDADERVENPSAVREYMLNNINNPLIEGISFSFFDAYMTINDFKPYKKGPLFNFRKLFGPERRDIVMAWKPTPYITFMTKPDLRVPEGIDPTKTIVKFYVQHYGKAISLEQWEETCDYYVNHFPQYADKWQSRKGKGIHNNKSDFGRSLFTWNDIKNNGGIKIN